MKLQKELEEAVNTLQFKVMECVSNIDQFEKRLTYLKYGTAEQSKLQEVNRLLVRQISIKESCLKAMKILNQHEL